MTDLEQAAFIQSGWSYRVDRNTLPVSLSCPGRAHRTPKNAAARHGSGFIRAGRLGPGGRDRSSLGASMSAAMASPRRC